MCTESQLPSELASMWLCCPLLGSIAPCLFLLYPTSILTQVISFPSLAMCAHPMFAVAAFPLELRKEICTLYRTHTHCLTKRILNIYVFPCLAPTQKTAASFLDNHSQTQPLEMLICMFPPETAQGTYAAAGNVGWECIAGLKSIPSSTNPKNCPAILGLHNCVE